jgi:tetratricopeptide (TPR) repeat protein
VRLRGWAGLAALVALAPALPVHGAPRPVEFPAPELVVTVTVPPLSVERRPLEMPAPPGIAAPALALGPAPLPRFTTTVRKPLPVVARPGGFPCVFAGLSRGRGQYECGVERVLEGDFLQARDAFEESIRIDPRGAHAPAAWSWLGEVFLLEVASLTSPAFRRAEQAYRAAIPLNPPPELLPHVEVGLARLVLSQGQTVEAAGLLERALGRVPPQPLALVGRFYLGVARLLAGRPADALDLWEDVARSGASGALVTELPFWRGVALAHRGDPDGAQALLGTFLVSAPGHPLRADAITQLGWIAFGRGQSAEAVQRFQQAESEGPRSELRVQLYVGLVRALLAAGDLGQARLAASRLAIAAPQDPVVGPPLLAIAETLAQRGQRRAAIDAYQDLLLKPLEPALRDYARYRLAETLEHEGRLAEAKDHHRQLRDQGRDEGVAQRASYRLGLLALRDGDAVTARREGEALLRAGTLAELREGTLLLIAEAALRGDDPNRAVAVLRTALREAAGSPRAGQTRLALGWALLRDGDGETALREWRAAAADAGVETRAAALLAVAEVTLRQGREAEALAALRGIGDLPAGHPGTEVVALARGVLAVRARAWQEAVQTLEALPPRERERSALAQRALGMARYQLGAYELAERHFRQAAAVAPQDLQHWLAVGLAGLAQGRLAEAEDALGRARFAAVDVARAADYGLVLAAHRRRDDDAFRDRAGRFVDRFPADPAVPLMLYALALKSLERGALAEAQGWTQRLLREHETSEAGTDALLALAEAARQRPEVAVAAHAELLRRGTPPEVRLAAWLGLAEAAGLTGNHVESRRGAEGFIGEAPADDARLPHAHLLLLRATRLQGQREPALRAAETFLRRFPAHPEAPAVALARGQLLADEGRWEAAQAAFQAARDGGEPPVAAEAGFWLGEALRTRGEHEAALAAYLGVTYLYPDSPWAPRGLQGAAQSYVARQMVREAGIVLRKLALQPGVDAALAQWAREALGRLGPAAADDASAPGRPGAALPARR